MFKVFFFLFAGILAGFLFKDRKKLIHFFDKATMWSVFLLLFLFGIEVGTNNKIVSNFLNVGVNGILLSIGAVAGSIFFAAPVYIKLFKKRDSSLEKKEN